LASFGHLLLLLLLLLVLVLVLRRAAIPRRLDRRCERHPTLRRGQGGGAGVSAEAAVCTPAAAMCLSPRVAYLPLSLSASLCLSLSLTISCSVSLCLSLCLYLSLSLWCMALNVQHIVTFSALHQPQGPCHAGLAGRHPRL